MARAAVHIITGGRDSGKTARIRALHGGRSGGDGYACPKLFAGEEHAGYDVLCLSTGMRMPLARRNDRLPPGWDESLTTGMYSFSGAGLSFIDSMLEALAAHPPERVYADEIGTLDLGRARFRALFAALLSSCGEVYAGVRQNRIAEFVEAFGITDYSITDLSAKEERQ